MRQVTIYTLQEEDALIGDCQDYVNRFTCYNDSPAPIYGYDDFVLNKTFRREELPVRRYVRRLPNGETIETFIAWDRKALELMRVEEDAQGELIKCRRELQKTCKELEEFKDMGVLDILKFLYSKVIRRSV